MTPLLSCILRESGSYEEKKSCTLGYNSITFLQIPIWRKGHKTALIICGLLKLSQDFRAKFLICRCLELTTLAYYISYKINNNITVNGNNTRQTNVHILYLHGPQEIANITTDTTFCIRLFASSSGERKQG